MMGIASLRGRRLSSKAWTAIWLALLCVQVALSAEQDAQPCIEEANVLTTADGQVPVWPSTVPLCASSTIVSLGQQSYYVAKEGAATAEKQVIHLWQPTAKQSALLSGNRQSDTPQHVFLAWERLDIGPDHDTTPWADRMQAVLQHGTMAGDVQPRAQKPLKHDHAEVHPAALLPRPEVLALHDTFAIVRVQSTKQLLNLSLLLPRDSRMARLSPAQPAVPSLSNDNESDLPAEPRFNPALHALTLSDTLSVPRLREDARVLTGEDARGQRIPTNEMDDALLSSPSSHWHSRHSATSEARLAAAWIRARMERDLAPLHGAGCQEWVYDVNYAPNVICTIPAAKKPSQKDHKPAMVLFSAHYDSRGTFGSTRAPGGDDDGSGTTMLLALARHLGKHRIRFEREVQLVAFSGEEQGLVGSQHYAGHLRNTSTPIRFQLQTDMIGYRKEGEPMQVAFPDRLATEAATRYVMALAKMYVPELRLGYTPACCSDHQSFWQQGYTSTWLFERAGPIADPCYHDSCDLTDRPGYDFDQIRASTRLVLATLLDVAGGVDWPY